MPEQENSETTKKPKQDLFSITGGDGPWQRRIFFALLTISVPGFCLNFSITFTAPDIDFWCARPAALSNLSVEEWKNVGLPPNDTCCSRFENANLTLEGQNWSNVIVACDSWEFDDSFYVSTILREWNLVCNRQWLVSLSKSVFMIGGLVSVIAFGNLSDRLGRRPTIAGSCVLLFISSTACAYSTSYTMFVISRFFIAVACSGYYNNLFVLLMEVLDPKKRAIYGNLVHLGWSIGYILLSAISWVVRDWFWIQVVFTAPCFLFLGVWWFIPESPRWLLSKRKLEEAERTLIKAAKRNGMDPIKIQLPLKNVLEDANQDLYAGETEENFMKLMRTPGLCQICLILFLAWFVISFMYFGLSFNTNELSGNPFLNFALSGVVEFPAFFYSIIAIKYRGRRVAAGGTLIAGGAACLSTYIFSSYLIFLDENWLPVILPMVAKFCVTSCLGILYVFTSELLPTVVRNSGLGWACFFEGIAAILAPFLHEMGVYCDPHVPYIVYGLLAIVSGITILFLPETRNQNVPDTIEEATLLFRRENKRDLKSKDLPVSCETKDSKTVC